MNYYNEHEPFAADWLRELIKAGHIPAGVVDDRDLQEVESIDLEGFTQCHFFAGIGGWSHALDLAGWPSTRPVWTGSPPCQPFSQAGQRKGLEDERHLWPHFFELIRQRTPPAIFGEQVATAIRQGWWDALQDDLERENYAAGMVVLPACSVGAPHLRQRLFFAASRLGDSLGTRLEGLTGDDRTDRGRERLTAHENRPTATSGGDGCVADTDARRRTGISGSGQEGVAERGQAGGLADTLCGSSARDTGAAASAQAETAGCGVEHRGQRHGPESGEPVGGLADDHQPGRVEQCPSRLHDQGEPGDDTLGRGALGGFWADADWLYCRDQKWRPVEPGAFPLANRATNRVGRVRGYGNAIVPQVAAEVIKAYMADHTGDST